MQSLGGIIIGDSSFFFGEKNSEMLVFSTRLNTGDPFSTCFNPIDTTKDGCVLARSRILTVLAIVTFSKIISSIIQSVMVLVISQFSKVASKNHAMHINHFQIFRANCIKCLILWRPESAPIPLVKPIEVACIYQGISISGKRDNLVGWVQRLRNRMSPKTTFWHAPPQMGFAAQPLF